MTSFFFSAQLTLGLVFWPGFSDSLVSSSPREFCAFHYRDHILLRIYTISQNELGDPVLFQSIREFYASYLKKKRKKKNIGLMSRVFANGPVDRGSIPGRVIPKTQKMVLDSALLNTQHHKVRIKGKVEQSREWSSALHNNSV